MFSFTRSRALAVAAVGLVAAAIAGSAAAVAHYRTVAALAGKGVTQVKVVSSAPPAEYALSSSAYADLPGATVKLSVPAATQALLLVRFSAETDCDAANVGARCAVRVLVNDLEAQPSQGIGTSFDVGHGGGQPILMQARSIDRSAGPLPPGSYTVRVQIATNLEPASLYLQDWSLTVERVKV
jgi:hypothetical protein